MLAALLEEGLAKAYTLSCTKPYSVELEAMPNLDTIEEYYRTYFLATRKGIEVRLADHSWWSPGGEDETNQKS